MSNTFASTSWRTPMQATYKMFRDFLNYSEIGPLSYDDWMKLPKEHKAAALFVEFYDQVSLALYKNRTLNTDEEEAVEVALQYLMKNVEIIEATPAKYTPNYIYRVMFNCIYCIYHDRKVDKDRLAHQVSNIVVSGDTEFNWFDIVPGQNSTPKELDRKEFWRAVSQVTANLGDEWEEDVNSVVAKLLRNPRTTYAPVSTARRQRIIAELKLVLEEFKDTWYI